IQPHRRWDTAASIGKKSYHTVAFLRRVKVGKNRAALPDPVPKRSPGGENLLDPCHRLLGQSTARNGAFPAGCCQNSIDSATLLTQLFYVTLRVVGVPLNMVLNI